jgi:hypothetical protein
MVIMENLGNRKSFPPLPFPGSRHPPEARQPKTSSVPAPEGLSFCREPTNGNSPAPLCEEVCPFVGFAAPLPEEVCPFVGFFITTAPEGLSFCREPTNGNSPALLREEVCPFVGFGGGLGGMMSAHLSAIPRQGSRWRDGDRGGMPEVGKAVSRVPSSQTGEGVLVCGLLRSPRGGGTPLAEDSDDDGGAFHRLCQNMRRRSVKAGAGCQFDCCELRGRRLRGSWRQSFRTIPVGVTMAT